jgi:hypothetical protein
VFNRVDASPYATVQDYAHRGISPKNCLIYESALQTVIFIPIILFQIHYIIVARNFYLQSSEDKTIKSKVKDEKTGKKKKDEKPGKTKKGEKIDKANKVVNIEMVADEESGETFRRPRALKALK